MRNAAHGDLGESFYDRDRSVASIIADGLPVSATLGLLATGIVVRRRLERCAESAAEVRTSPMIPPRSG
jgi:hypothetical protein